MTSHEPFVIQKPKITFKFIISIIGVCIFIALIFPKPCDNFHGWSGPNAKMCNCLGFKLVEKDKNFVDGDYRSYCVGLGIPKPIHPDITTFDADPDNVDLEEMSDLLKDSTLDADNRADNSTETETSPAIPARRFYVRPSPDADIAFFLEAELRAYHIEYHEGPGGAAETVIVLTDPDLNNSELHLGIPHIAVPEEFTNITPVENPYLGELYRIAQDPLPISEFSYRFIYSNQITAEGECPGPGGTGTLTAPCGLHIIKFSENQGLHVSCETDNSNPTSCDEVMETLRLSE